MSSDPTKEEADFEAGQAVMEDVINQNEKQPCCTRRRFQLVTCISVLIAIICLCIIVPVVVIKGNNATKKAEAYVYGDVWIELGTPVIGEQGNQELGESLALNGDGSMMAVGSNGHNTNQGLVNVFHYVGTAWTPRGQTLMGVTRDDNIVDNFGSSAKLSSSGNILAIGAFGDSTGPNQKPGSVTAYEFSTTNDRWEQLGSRVTGLEDGDQFGSSLSMARDGKSWIAGGDNLRGPDIERNGYAAIYQLIGGNWVQKGAAIPGNNGEWTGYAVAMSGNGETVCVGDRAYTIPDSGTAHGRARCFEWKGGEWKRKGGDILGKTDGAQMGYSLALSDSGTSLVVGARKAGENTEGSVGVYHFSGGDWKQKGEDQLGDAFEDQAGFQVAINSDGSVIAYSARAHDGNGVNSGVVRVLQYTANDKWELLGFELSGGSANDYFGESVALSERGSVMAASSNQNSLEYTQAYVLV